MERLRLFQHLLVKGPLRACEPGPRAIERGLQIPAPGLRLGLEVDRLLNHLIRRLEILPEQEAGRDQLFSVTAEAMHAVVVRKLAGRIDAVDVEKH